MEDWTQESLDNVIAHYESEVSKYEAAASWVVAAIGKLDRAEALLGTPEVAPVKEGLNKLVQSLYDKATARQLAIKEAEAMKETLNASS